MILSILGVLPQIFAALNPVIFIPGYGGSQIEAKINRSTVPHYICSKRSDWFTLWFSISELAWPVIDCFIDNMRLLYDREKRCTKNNEGVEIRIPGFGKTESIEYFDPSRFSVTSYFAKIVKELTAYNYTKGINLRGAPYDFRKGPNELKDYFKQVQSLIEETYSLNNQSPVVLISHSMGCPLTLYWLQNAASSWKNKYIKSWVGLSCVWYGAAKSLRLVISGDNIDIFLVNPLLLRPAQRSYPSTLFLFPSKYLWPANEVIVSRPGRNYTVNDYKQLLIDLDYTDGIDILNAVSICDPRKPPNVEFHAIYGVQLATPSYFFYTNSTWPDKPPVVTYSSGDGTVEERSLRGHKIWEKKQKQFINTTELPKVEHLALLSDMRVVDYIKNLLSN